jgi:hypothetical protein
VLIKFIRKEDFTIPTDLLLFVLLFSVLIPTISTLVFYLRNNFSFVGYQGLPYLKAYIFLFFTFFLYFDKNKLINVFVRLLLILSIITILLFLLTTIYPKYIGLIYSFGDKYGIFAMPVRHYGSLSYRAVYFHTAPLLIISLGYYLFRFIREHRLHLFISLSITVLALLLSGTRNTVFSTILISVVFYLVFSRNINNRQLLIILILSIIVFFLPTIVELINSSPTSDKTRLQFASEYFRLIRDPVIFLFGQGFGSSFVTSERGFVSLTELSYFEIFRRFGLVLGLLQLFLMFYPLVYWKSLPTDKMWIIIAYAYYLFMIFFNPFYFSSNGMIILSFVLVSKYEFPDYER